MAEAPTDEEIRQVVEEVPNELRQYGIDVGPFTGVFIIREHMHPRLEDARAMYTKPLDTFSLYKPFFEQDEPLRQTVVHEYVHKDQWLDAQDTTVPDEYREAFQFLNDRYLRYLRDLEALGVNQGIERVGGLTTTDWRIAAPKAVARDVSPQYDAIYDAARAEAARWEGTPRQKEVVNHFTAAINEELTTHTLPEEVTTAIDTFYDMMAHDTGPSGDAAEIEAYYIDIALSGRIDDEDYLQHEYEEIRKPGKNYGDPNHIIDALSGAIEEHQERRAAGEDEQSIITDIHSTLRADIPGVEA